MITDYLYTQEEGNDWETCFSEFHAYYSNPVDASLLKNISSTRGWMLFTGDDSKRYVFGLRE